MQFDGVERYKQQLKERHLGALRREGFQPARRHPSASRRRYKEAPEFCSDGVYLGGSELRPQDSGEMTLRKQHHIPTAAAPQQGGYSSGSNAPRGSASVEPSGTVRHQRSRSAPPVRSMEAGTRISRDLKLKRATCVAQSLTQMGQDSSSDPFQRPEVKELYGWLKAISLHEYLPALLELGVDEVMSTGLHTAK